MVSLRLKLGADVPIFIYGFSAWAEGIGELFAKITIPEQWVVVIKPDCHVDTKEIFSVKELTRDSKSITISDFLAGQCQNDCLDVVSELYQSVKEALIALSIFSQARLTGTGACVFAQFENKADAEKAFQALKDSWQVYIAEGLNKSPLLAQIEKF